jgi:uncharacterized repeat protein (TIGR01451 family)
LLTISTVATNSGTYTNNAVFITPVTNAASVIVTVMPQTVQADLAITATASASPVNVRQQDVFTLTLQNLGPDDVLTNIVVTDCLPTSFQVVTNSTMGGGTPGTYNPSECTWTLPGGLSANTAVSLSITAQAVAPGTYTNTASVAVPAGIVDPNTNDNTSSVAVTVNESTGPPMNLVCPSNITVGADGPNGASAVFYSGTASGGCTLPKVAFNPPSGSIMPIGTNQVTCTASDSCGDQASCSFTVTVTPPALTLICSPDLTVAATNTSGTEVVYYTTVGDGCSGSSVVSTPPSGSLFHVGPTQVTCTATDSYGQQAECSFMVTVTPPSPPVQTTITTFNYDTNAGLLNLEWTSAAGKIYTIQESLDLNSWQDFLEGIPAGGNSTSNQIPIDPTVPANFFRIREDVPVGPFSSDPILSVGEDGIMGVDGGQFQPTLPFIQSVQQYYISRLTPTPLEYTTWTVISNDVSDQVLANALFIDYLAATNATTAWTPEAITAKNDALRWYYLVNMKRSPLLPGTNGPWARGIDPSVATNLETSGIPVFVATESTNARQAYTNSCALKGVPIPPDVFTGGWVNLGQIQDPFISETLYAELWIYVSQNPPGVCLALPRYIIPAGAAAPPANASIELLGLICLGFKAQADGNCYACFWDNPAANRPTAAGAAPAAGFWKRGVARPVTDFVGGADLNDPGQVGVGGQCSDCHAGQNSFVVHPRKAPFKAAYNAVQDPAVKAHGANLNGDVWYTPLGLDPSWPQNPNPGNNQGGACVSCHKPGDKAGRLPMIYDGVPGYCETILATATQTKFVGGKVVAGVKPPNPTMPPGSPGNPDFDDMKALYLECMKALPKAAAAPNPFPAAPAVVSAPSVIGPLYASATMVAVQGAVLGATVTLYTNGVAAATIANARSPSQVEFTISALTAGETVTASQTVADATNVSAPQMVVDYFTNSPGGLPAPFLDELTIYQGANVIEAIHDPGVTITILRNGIQVAQVATSSSVTIIPLTNGSPFQVGDVFEAYETLEGISSTNSDPVDAISDPTNLPAPSLDTLQTYPGQELLAIDGLVNGAQASVFVNGVVAGQFSTPETSQEEFDLTTSGLGRPLQAGDQVVLSQTLGGTLSSEPSTNLPPTATTCDSLPAPSILTPVEGVTIVEITQSIPGAQILVFDGSGAELGCGSGSTINLSRPLVCGDILTVVQQIGACTSATGYRITVAP